MGDYSSLLTSFIRFFKNCSHRRVIALMVSYFMKSGQSLFMISFRSRAVSSFNFFSVSRRMASLRRPSACTTS